MQLTICHGSICIGVGALMVIGKQGSLIGVLLVFRLSGVLALVLTFSAIGIHGKWYASSSAY